MQCDFTRVSGIAINCDLKRLALFNATDQFYIVADKMFFEPALYIPPNAPTTPSGPALGLPEISYSYFTTATHPNGYQGKYTFDWGDGATSVTGLVDSGTTASASPYLEQCGNI